jgi:hypothetical protein
MGRGSVLVLSVGGGGGGSLPSVCVSQRCPTVGRRGLGGCPPLPCDCGPKERGFGGGERGEERKKTKAQPTQTAQKERSQKKEEAERQQFCCFCCFLLFFAVFCCFIGWFPVRTYILCFLLPLLTVTLLCIAFRRSSSHFPPLASDFAGLCFPIIHVSYCETTQL